MKYEETFHFGGLSTCYNMIDFGFSVVFILKVLVIYLCLHIIRFIQCSVLSSPHYVHSMAQYSPDASKSVTVDLVPLVFMAIHGTIEEDGT